ncbi:MAG TPA: transcription antitermination factor NusB, partial [Roseiarcus sp.]|nr:transcription antitermination factor NusB [Roseiarcus sp.]
MKDPGPKRSDKRSAARLAASQALYQMEITGKGLNDILAEFEVHWIGREIEGEAYRPADPAFFRDVVSGVLNDQVAIDRAIDDRLAKGWPLKRVEALMRAI